MKGTSSKNQFMLWQTLAGSSLIGLVASFIQTVERIKFADDASAKLICDVNAKLSCSSVFDAWQSSVFGFSNSIMCLAFFSILLGVALVGVTGSQVLRGLRLTMHAASVFFLGFGAWYLWQSSFVIGSLCLYCLFCYAAVIILNAAWLRINIADLKRTPKNTWLQLSVTNNYDLIGWTLYALLVAAMIAIGVTR